MSYISVAEAAVTMQIPVKILRDLCEKGGIKGAVRFGRVWAIPETIRRDELVETQRYPWIRIV